MSRFDYVKYDEKGTALQASMKDNFTHIETLIDRNCISPRAKALALTKLEECYMWVGKAIRDDQISRNGTAELQEERNNS